MAAIIRGLDRQRIEPVVFCPEKSRDRIEKGIRSSDIAIVSFPSNYVKTVQIIRDAKCDVIYHWQIGTDPKNYFLPFAPLAPVQCTSWGSHDTTGIPSVDCFLSSEVVERAGAEADYTESLHRFGTLPTWQPWPKRVTPTSREELGLPTQGPLYFCPHRLAKFHPRFDELLCGVLRESSESHILVIESTRARENEILQRRLWRALGPSLYRRILFCSRLNASEFYRVLSVSSAVLDSPVYSAGLTAYDAFGYKVPVVTIEGKLMCARYTAGLYRRMGIDSLVAADSEDYVRIAVQLGADADFREEVCRLLSERSPALFEDAAAIAEHESFFLSCGVSGRFGQGERRLSILRSVSETDRALG